MASVSFEVRGRAPERVVEALLARIPETGGEGLLLLSGELAGLDHEVAELVRASGVSGHWLIAPCPGLLSERGEIEGESAAVGMVFPPGTSSAFIHTSPTAEFGAHLGDELAASPGASTLVLIRGDQTDDSWLVRLDERLGAHEERLFGGGILPGKDLTLVSGSALTRGAIAAFVIRPQWLGRVTASSACRLLCPLSVVTKSRGPLLLEMDGFPALSLLSTSTATLDEQPLVLLAIATSGDALSPEGRNLALRAIGGVDPIWGGILIGEELPEGTRVAFAVRDAHSARTDLEAHLRTLRMSCAGTAPAFGFYVNCSGRGLRMYESKDVDVRLINRHLAQSMRYCPP